MEITTSKIIFKKIPKLLKTIIDDGYNTILLNKTTDARNETEIIVRTLWHKLQIDIDQTVYSVFTI